MCWSKRKIFGFYFDLNSMMSGVSADVKVQIGINFEGVLNKDQQQCFFLNLQVFVAAFKMHIMHKMTIQR